jgi:saccharopine dehydrogenase (NAD+, L-lysine-forming)
VPWDGADEAQLICSGKSVSLSWFPRICFTKGPLIFGRRENIIKWDLDETAKGGPFDEILDVDIFVNCIYLNSAIPSFITRDHIIAAGTQRKLAVVVDVSCDTTNPFNPIPIYSINTTFSEPTVAVDVG